MGMVYCIHNLKVTIALLLVHSAKPKFKCKLNSAVFGELAASF